MTKRKSDYLLPPFRYLNSARLQQYRFALTYVDKLQTMTRMLLT